MNEAEQTQHMSDAFVHVISTVVGEPVALAGRPQRLSGGFWAQIWGVELAGAPGPFDGPMVLRVMPDQTLGIREATVQRVIADTGFRTPRVLASGVALGLGEAYIVMDRIEGKTPLSGLTFGADLLGAFKLLRSIPTMLADTANALHALDPAKVQVALREAGVELDLSNHPFRMGIDLAASECPSAGFVDLGRWLDDHKPVPGPPVICHGDLHPLNVLIDTNGASWLLDWTTATIAPKEMDIGLTTGLLRCAPLKVPKFARPVVALITNRLAETFITAVSNVTAGSANRPVDRSAVDWWEALQCGRCLAQLVHGRLHTDGVVGPDHPFETSVDAMRRRLQRLTGVLVTPPARARPSGERRDRS